MRACRKGAPSKGRKGDSSARRAGLRDEGVSSSALSSNKLETCPAQTQLLLDCTRLNPDLLGSYQATGEAVCVTRAVQDDVLDDPEGFRLFVQEQIFWVCEARQVAQPEATDGAD